MCGLWGWQWLADKKPSKRQRQAVAFELAKGNDTRGGQSWGVWSPRLVLRGIGQAQAHSGRFSGLDCMFGHSRYATHGTNTLENTHPFIRNGVALSHNGVIGNHDELNRTLSRGFVVDSQHILQHMLDGKPFAEIKGYGAIVWNMPSEPDSIYMGRLSDRGQLFICKTECGVVWSSDEAHARRALKAANISISHPYEVDVGKTYYAEEGRLFVDESLPSIKVSQPDVYRAWESYGYTPQQGRTWPTLWCNEHLREYTRCPCQGGVAKNPHIVEVPPGEKTPEQGQKYEPKSTVGQVLQVSQGAQSSLEFKLYCNQSGCTDRQIAGTGYCSSHAPVARPVIVPNPPMQYLPCRYADCNVRVAGSEYCQTHKPKQVSTPGRPTLCAMSKCYEHRIEDSLWCPKHSPMYQEEQQRLAALPAPQVSSRVSQDLRSEWAAETEDTDLTRAQSMELVQDLAGWWLETNHGLVNDVTNGLTGPEVLDLAISMGFDAEAAIDELDVSLNEQEQSDATSTPAGVQQPKAEHQPTDRGASAALVGSTSNRMDEAVGDLLRQGRYRD